jgi:hypothetical protein
MFDDDDVDALWCNGKEIAHFDADDLVDLRLTKAVIRELRPELRSDGRVELRKNASDWIRVRISSASDVAFVAELGQRAADAHRPPRGTRAKPAPAGAELERRRRLH